MTIPSQLPDVCRCDTMVDSPVSPETVEGLYDQVNFYDRQGKYEQAEPLLLRVVALCKRQWG